MQARSMATKQRVEQSFDLLSLPWPALAAVVKCLENEDKLSLMAVCRLLCDVVLATNSARLVIETHNNYKGIEKVLPAAAAAKLYICRRDNQEDAAAPCDAASTFLGLNNSIHDSHVLPKFPGVQACIIAMDGELRSLVPDFMARTCPNLKTIDICNAQLIDELRFGSEPIQSCTSLETLSLHGYRLEPYQPIPYTASEFASKLPNIKELSIYGFETPQAMIEAWGEQLVRLETAVRVKDGVPTPNIQNCINVQALGLQYHDYFPVFPLPLATQNLTYLTIVCNHWLTKQHLKQLMQLPSLTDLNVPGFEDLDEDLTEQACCWQLEKLTITGRSFAFVCLGQFPLQKLKKLIFHDEVTIYLPDASEQSNMDAVHACIKNTPSLEEVMVLPDPSPDADYIESTKVIISPESDADGHIDESRLAHMISGAAPRLPKADACDLTNVHGVEPVAAVCNWAQTGIKSLIIHTSWIFSPDHLRCFVSIKDLACLSISYVEGSQSGLPERFDDIFASARSQERAVNVSLALGSIAHQVYDRLVLESRQPLQVLCNWPCPVGTVAELFGALFPEAGLKLEKDAVLDQQTVARNIEALIKSFVCKCDGNVQCTFNEMSEKWTLIITPPPLQPIQSQNEAECVESQSE